MATNTTNLSLIKPAGTDKVRIAQINQNMDLIDTAIGSVGSTSLQSQIAAVDSGLAIVSNGNTHVAIASGQYVYIRNHSSLSEGLYKATAAISANATLSTSNVTKVSTGGMNELKSAIDSVNSQFVNLGTITGSTKDEMIANACTAFIALGVNDKTLPVRIAWSGHGYYIGNMQKTGSNAVTYTLSTTNDINSGRYDGTVMNNGINDLIAQLVKIKTFQDTNATTTRTLTVPRASLHYIVVFYGYMSASWVGMVQMTAAGGLRINEIKSSNNVVIGTENNTLTFTVADAQYFRVLDIVLNGNEVS